MWIAENNGKFSLNSASNSAHQRHLYVPLVWMDWIWFKARIKIAVTQGVAARGQNAM